MTRKFWKILITGGIIFLAIILIDFFVGTRYTTQKGNEESITQKVGLLPKSVPSVERESTPQTGEKIPSRMIVKTGYLNLIVKDVLETVRKISKFAEENGGWVVSAYINEQDKVPSGTITVRIPAEKFGEAIGFFRGLAVRVSDETTQSQDITEEYIDLEARLRNLEATETQLLELMGKAGKISEILEVQRELANIRGQIEQIKGRMQYLKQNVEMSSITVNLALSEELLPVPPADKWKPKYVLLKTWKSVLNFWKEFSYFLIRLVIWAQVWVPLLIIIILGRKFWQRIRQKG